MKLVARLFTNGRIASRKEHRLAVPVEQQPEPRERAPCRAFRKRTFIPAPDVVHDRQQRGLARPRAPGDDVERPQGERHIAALSISAVNDDLSNLSGHGRTPHAPRMLTGEFAMANHLPKNAAF
jgi:hypothetical protein